MANVLDFQPRPVNHAPSQFGFGFGLGGPVVAPSAWPSAITPASPFHQLSSTSYNQPSPSRVQKRRHEEDEPVTRDHSMDRSPTPERPKRSVPKRARVADPAAKDDKDAKENRSPNESRREDDIDVGVLLASLPSQSLLPLLTSLIASEPALKPRILSLIPRPTLETATQVLATSSRKLRDAYPYSMNVSPTQPLVSTGFGFGNARSTLSPFGRSPPPQSPSSSAFPANNGMRDSYVTSRMRPHIEDFVAAAMSYLPYFSCVSQTTEAASSQPTLQSIVKEHVHPSETYSFLSALTEHLLSQPQLTQSSLQPLLLPRLTDEWKAWIDKLDMTVNQQGGMFAGDVVRTWERGLDSFAQAEGDGGSMMRSVRDLWIARVGWLVGRQANTVWRTFELDGPKVPDTAPSHVCKDGSLYVFVPLLGLPSRGPKRCASTPPSSASVLTDASPNSQRRMNRQAKFGVHTLAPVEMEPRLAPTFSKTAPSTIERATSRNTLYKNLLVLSASPHSATLPALVDYHELHPGLRSTRTYNFLIALAIRQSAFGTVQMLFSYMATDGLKPNAETAKLETRWFVRSGFWDQALVSVKSRHPVEIPLPLWLELFHGVKSGVLPRRRPVSTIKTPEGRFQELMQNLPTFHSNQVGQSARQVSILVRTMLSLKLSHSALTLATHYLHGLPRHVDARWAERCTDIIDALVAYEANKRGLLDFYATRRKLAVLLAIHPGLRPSSKTLYLLLGTLRQAKRCGTLSWRVLVKFRSRWGPQVEDRRVRRRVASLALIERRLDVFDTIFAAEAQSRVQAHAASAPGPNLRRAPFREIFPGHGMEQRLWRKLAIRAQKIRSPISSEMPRGP
ncbi:unnamed protein product [Mycena citricolor]|uniref:Tethering factor for nuclear proteasome STS1 n=1 Tax=Mycena citricolor TaxID=2018698 RepID=A0AAD2HQA9_9AGAR|nr:unnamed protein product [Mycena citricolor]